MSDVPPTASRRQWLLFAVGTLILSTSVAVATEPVPPPLPTGWKRVIDPRFSIDMPPRAVRTATDIKGDPVSVYTAGATDGTLYAAGQYPRAAATSTDENKALTEIGLGAIANDNCKGKLVKADVGVYPWGKGLNFAAECLGGTKAMAGMVRLIDNRFYLQAVTLSGSTMDQASYAHFLSSFATRRVK